MSVSIQRPDIASALARLTRLTGRYSPKLEEVVLPVIVCADLGITQQPAIRRQVTLNMNISPVAAEQPTWRIEVPGSIICVIRNIWIECENTAEAHFNMFPGTALPIPPANVEGGVFTDSRIAAQAPAVVITATTQVAALADIHWRRGITSPPGTFITDLGWVIGTGDPDLFSFMEFQVGILNERVRFCFAWDEYQII